MDIRGAKTKMDMVAMVAIVEKKKLHYHGQKGLTDGPKRVH